MVLLEGLAVLAAKITSASTAAQAAAGLGIAVAGVTGAGAVGALPGPVQDVVAGAVETVSPFDLPDSEDGRHSLSAQTDDSRTHDSGTDGPGDVPATDPTDVPGAEDSPAAAPTTPSSSPGPEAGDDGGVHQNRGGRTATPTIAVPAEDSGSAERTSGRDHPEDDATGGAAASSSHSEVEDHEDDRSGHGGGDDDTADDDNSGHGSGDDD